MEQADKPVFFGSQAQHFHNQHIVVHCQIQLFKERGDLKLRRCCFVVPGLRRDAQPPELTVHICHKRQDPGADRAVVVVFQLLMFRRCCSEKRSAALDQVRTGIVEMAVDQKIFLFCAETDAETGFGIVEPERLHQACYRA